MVSDPKSVSYAQRRAKRPAEWQDVDTFQGVPKLAAALDSEPDGAQVAEVLARYADGVICHCPECTVLGEVALQVRVSAEKIADLRAPWNDAMALMLGLQREMKAIMNDFGRVQRHFGVLVVAHPRCGACGILTGEGHLHQDRRKEPFGEEMVCFPCYHDLQLAHRKAFSVRETNTRTSRSA